MACYKFLVNFYFFSWIPRMVSFLDLSSIECLLLIWSLSLFQGLCPSFFSLSCQSLQWLLFSGTFSHTLSIDVSQRFYVEGGLYFLSWHMFVKNKNCVFYSFVFPELNECLPHSRYSVIVDAVSNHQIIWQSYYSINYQIIQ